MNANPINPEHLLAQAGGVGGLIYSSLPVVIFVAVSSFVGLLPAIASALGMAALVLLWRLLRRESVQPVVSGFFGVVVCALVAFFMGKSKDYFLVGIWMSLLWAIVFALSILFRRPMVGYLWSWATGRDQSWRRVRQLVYAFDIATLSWTLVFGARFAVQSLLYQADQTGWLGVARIAMGWPLTAMAALATYWAIMAVQRALPAVDGAAASDDAGNEADSSDG